MNKNELMKRIEEAAEADARLGERFFDAHYEAKFIRAKAKKILSAIGEGKADRKSHDWMLGRRYVNMTFENFKGVVEGE